MNKLVFTFNKLKFALEQANENKDLEQIRNINNKIHKLMPICNTILSDDELNAKNELIKVHSTVLKTLKTDQRKLKTLLTSFEKNKDGLNAYKTTEFSCNF